MHINLANYLINVYIHILAMSVVSGFLYLILKLSCKVTMKYFTPSWHYYTYAWVYTFMILPYHKLFETPFSKLAAGLCPNLNLNAGNFPAACALPYITEQPLLTNNDFSLTISDKIKIFFMLNSNHIIPYILLSGTVVFSVISIIQNIKLNRRIFSDCKLTDGTLYRDIISNCAHEFRALSKITVYISPYASTPFLYGILRPRILLPDIDFSSEELRHVFFHELTHWKRRDPWLKCFMILANAVHWFNPLAYIMRRDIDRFCEMSCDEKVIKPMNSEERKRYCKLLLKVLWRSKAGSMNANPASAFCDTKKYLERRVDLILKTYDSNRKKSNSVFAALATVLAITLGIAACTATGVGDLSGGSSSENQINESYDSYSSYVDVARNADDINHDTKNETLIDAVKNASGSVEAVNELFGNSSEIYAVEGNTIYYSKIYNSFDDAKKAGISFSLNFEEISGDVSLQSVYRLAQTEKFIANYVGTISNPK